MDHTAGWMPHGHCFHWEPLTLAGWVATGVGLWLVFSAIPRDLMGFHHDRPSELPWSAAAAFAAFIATCGISHLVSVVSLWYPVYRLQVLVNAVTLLSALPAVVGLRRARAAARGMATRDQHKAAMVAAGHTEADADAVWSRMQSAAHDMRSTSRALRGDHA